MAQTKMSFSLNEGVAKRLSEYAAAAAVSKACIINEALESYFAQMEEDRADAEAAAAAWREFEKSGEKTYTSEELRKEFGL